MLSGLTSPSFPLNSMGPGILWSLFISRVALCSNEQIFIKIAQAAGGRAAGLTSICKCNMIDDPIKWMPTHQYLNMLNVMALLVMIYLIAQVWDRTRSDSPCLLLYFFIC